MKEKEPQTKPRRKPELLSAGIIVLSLLLCVGVSAVEFQTVRRAADAAARETAAGILTAGGGGEYRQLSDPLLVLVNDWVPLPEDWQVIPRMVDDEQVDLRMYDDLLAMFKAAEKEDVWFWVASGYRSVEDQQIVLDRAVRENVKRGMGEEEARREALRTIARPGHSEHHTGLAVDLNDVSDDFEGTAAYRWLREHGAEYGFVQRYRRDKAAITGIDNESWHYRYVGREHARAMERLDFCLEEYTAYLKREGMR